MGLYIGGAQCKYARFKKSSDWEILEEKQDIIWNLEDKFGVSVSQQEMNGLNDGMNLVISNQPVVFSNIFNGGAFAVNLNIERNEAFEKNVQAFIQALESELIAFHGLKWSESKFVYFVTS